MTSRVMIEFASVLKSKVGKVRFDGDPQHAEFQFRGAQDVSDNTKQFSYYLRLDGKGGPWQFRNWSNNGNESKFNFNHINLPRTAMSFVLERHTCCYLCHPQNPKPARYSKHD